MQDNPRLKTFARRMRHEPSPAEKRLWSKLRDRRLSGWKFRRQHWLGPYILDFYCPDAELAVELDGDSHALNGAEEADRERTAYLEAHGLKVIRFWNHHVHEDEDWVLVTIRQTCDERTGRATTGREGAAV